MHVWQQVFTFQAVVNVGDGLIIVAVGCAGGYVSDEVDKVFLTRFCDVHLVARPVEVAFAAQPSVGVKG